MKNEFIQKPCLINSSQGFSVLYNSKYLYSKYNPEKSILQTISSTNILPGTLILCYSPILPYGIIELIQKIPENCLLLGVDFDKNLFNFTQDLIQNGPLEIKTNWQKILDSKKFSFISINEAYDLPVIENKKNYILQNGFIFPSAGTFKRVLSINFSNGIQFHQELYSELKNACTKAMMTFWSNRVTLLKFGHNYSKNFFNNLKLYPKTTPIENYFSTIKKSIILFGAGQSLNEGIDKIKNSRQDFFILCADTALQPLLQNNITPDGVFIEEAQNVITKAFIGTISSKTQIFAGLSSISTLFHNFEPKQISFFTTLYSDTDFLHNLQENNLIPPVNEPFGSVGLTTVYYALKFRYNDSVPIFIYGLDFSYSIGITHGKGTMAHFSRLFSTNRLIPLQNYNSAFSGETYCVNDKNNNKIITTRILSNYSNLFCALFSNHKNIFDSGNSGLNLSIPRKSPIKSQMIEIKTNNQFITQHKKEKIDEYFNNEIKQLTKLKNILTGDDKELKTLNSDKIENYIKTNISNILEKREYLYLHFPDGWKFSTDIGFLKRVRFEIDVFLKIFNS